MNNSTTNEYYLYTRSHDVSGMPMMKKINVGDIPAMSDYLYKVELFEAAVLLFIDEPEHHHFIVKAEVEKDEAAKAIKSLFGCKWDYRTTWHIVESNTLNYRMAIHYINAAKVEEERYRKEEAE